MCVDELAKVRARIERAAGGDLDAVLEAGALTDAAALLAAAPRDDLAAARSAGVLHALRAWALPDKEDALDFACAAELLRPAYQAGHDVPEIVREIVALDIPDFLTDIASALLIHARHTLDVRRAGDAADHLRFAMRLTGPDHPERGAHLTNTHAAYRIRYDVTDDITDLDQALRAAVALWEREEPDTAAWAKWAFVIGKYWHWRYLHTGAHHDCDQAVRHLHLAVEASAEGTPELVTRLRELGVALDDRADSGGGADDAGAAVTALERALKLAGDPDDLWRLRSQLSDALRLRFDLTAHAEDLVRAERLGRDVLAATDANDRAYVNRLSRLGIILRTKFEQTGDAKDLNDAIDLLRAAAEPVEHHWERAKRLSNLADALRLRVERVGSLADADDAVDIAREMVEESAAEDPDLPMLLSTLASVLLTRFERSGELADLDESITRGAEAAARVTAGHIIESIVLTNHSTLLIARYDRLGRPDDIDDAIAIARQVVNLPETADPSLTERRINLALPLLTRYRRAATPDDADADADAEEAIDLLERVVRETPPAHPRRSTRLTNAAFAYLCKLQKNKRGAVAEFDRAVALAEEAERLSHPDDGERVLTLANLGAARALRYEALGSLDDARAALTADRAAATLVTARPAVRVQTARQWGFTAVTLADWPEAVAAYTLAVELIGTVAPRELDRGDVEYALGELSGLGAEAAAGCLLAGDHEQALRLWDQSVGVLLSRALDTRTDVARLATADEELAAQFTRLRRRLDNGSPFADGGQRRAFGQELADLLDRIRAVPNLRDFLLPPEFAELLPAAEHGPVVVIVIAEHCSAAMALTPEGVVVVDLPDATPDAVRDQVGALLGATGDDSAPDVLTGVLRWAWDAITGPVLDALALTGVDPLPRLWWCPTGLLSLVPLHAAGHHDDASGLGPPRTVLDRVVSSYTPTVRALLHARRPRADRPVRPLVIAMPKTDGEADLPGAELEAAAVRSAIADAEVLIGADAHKAAVVDRVADHDWVHFGCHGNTDLDNPSASGLLLADHKAAPLTVLDVNRLDLADAEFAFLSACSTARTGSALPDEAIHLASAFQIAGYRHVVATLWPIADRHAVRMTTRVYEAIAEEGVGATPYALHEATRDLRDTWRAFPDVWAGYVHNGA
ncbi:CHAT domain-containing protein [Actinokineospora sp. 24-640]